jgi:hypothetical protein
MKLKALLTALFLAGVTASLALGAAGQARDDGTTSTVTSTTEKTRCKPVMLAGPANAGSVAFTAAKTSKSGQKLAGSAVTLAIPAGARVLAVACTDASGALTLRSLRVGAAPRGRKPGGKEKGRS